METKTVKIDFSNANDRAELLNYICVKQKLDPDEAKKKADIKGPAIGYEGITKLLRVLKISYSFDAETNGLIAHIPVVPAEGVKIMTNPQNIENTLVDYVQGIDPIPNEQEEDPFA